MEGPYNYSSLLLICFITVARGNEDVQHVINQVSQLQVDLLGKIVPSYIHSQVEQALARILGDQSIYDEVRHLRHNQQRHVHNMERRLKTLEDDRDEKMKTIVELQEEHKKSEVRMTDLQREVNSSQRYVSTVYIDLNQEVNSTQFKLHDVEDNYSKIMKDVALLTKVVANSMERRLKTLEDGRDEKMTTIMRLQEEHEQCEVRMTDLQRELNTSQLHVSNVYSELKQEGNSTQLKLDYMKDNFSKILNKLTVQTKVVNNSMERRLETLEDDRDEKTRTIERLQGEHQQCEVRMEDLQREVNASQLHVSTVYSHLKQESNSTQFKLDDIEDNFSKIMNNVTLLTKVVDSSMERRLKTLEDDRDEKTRTIEILQEEHQQCEVRMEDIQREVNASQLHVSNVYSELKQGGNSIQFKLDDIEDNFSKIMNIVTLLKKVVYKMDNITKYCSCVTPRPAEEMNRILVIQRRSSTVQYPHQIDLHNNEMGSYTHLHTSNTRSSTYDPISRRIIFSRYNPAGIYSSRLDVGGVETVKLNVKANGIVVDADRRIIFLTTYHPRWDISRMTTTGKYFRVIVDLTDYSPRSPNGIAIDGRQKVIYFCVWDRLSSVDYNGKNLRTLHTGGYGRYTVVFDEGKNALFFGIGRNVMMKSLTTNMTTEIMALGYSIQKFVVYNNSLYISSWNAGNIDVIHLENNVHINLRNMEHKSNDILVVP